MEDKREQIEKEIIDMIANADYPSEHPFLDYPNTPESQPVKMFMLIYSYTQDRDMISNLIDKCRGVDNGKYTFEKYLQGMSEVSCLYYLLVGAMKRGIKPEIKDENYKVIDNEKIFEFSLCFDNPPCVLAIEVKALSCDMFSREETLTISDGQKIIKPFFDVLKDSDDLKKFPDHIVLKSSTHYRQVKSNIMKIQEKCTGTRLTEKRVYCFGFLYITGSTSQDEFYSYLFNEEFGLFEKVWSSNIDVLVLMSLDEKCDLLLNNLYENDYVQTMLPHPTDELKKLCEVLRLDNYIVLENQIRKDVDEKSKEKYGFYKVTKKDGIIAIVPENASEEGINNYIERLKSNEI